MVELVEEFYSMPGLKLKVTTDFIYVTLPDKKVTLDRGSRSVIHVEEVVEKQDTSHPIEPCGV